MKVDNIRYQILFLNLQFIYIKKKKKPEMILNNDLIIMLLEQENQPTTYSNIITHVAKKEKKWNNRVPWIIFESLIRGIIIIHRKLTVIITSTSISANNSSFHTFSDYNNTQDQNMS